MPDSFVNGHRMHYELTGSASAPTLVLSNSLGTTLAMWDDQVASLAQTFHVLRYDTRGHGRSQVTPGDYTIAQLATDVLELTTNLGIDDFSFCGLSMGGLIGQWLAVHAGKRLRKAILCNTAAKIGDAEGWNARITAARRDGLAAVAEGAIARWFTPEFIASAPARVARIKEQLLGCSSAGYAANCAAVRDADFRDRLTEIRVPTLVIAGAADAVTTVADGQALVAAIPGATLAVMNAAHLSNIGDQMNFDAAVSSFLPGRK